ncbi:MAG: hypothetical protein QOE54_3496 [Streptosporangiaceae bacterium]|jgi:hypothetical protein|nr:hypothetical protein [Streptosporangiaceae bacterium]MDX6431130.1 hypothetical protein [Streptosporangiaceae bacterium]
MSHDLVALVREQPDAAAVLDGMMAMGEQLEVRTHPAAVHVHDLAGRLLVSIETPMLVQVPGEVERLLGVQVNVPTWWVNIRAAAEPPEAERIARKFSDDLVRWQGGMVWPA